MCLVSCLLLSTYPLCAEQARTDSPFILKSLKNAIDHSLRKIDRRLIAASHTISATGLDSAETEKTLFDLCNSVRGSIDCATVDLEGRMVSVMPEEYKKYKGADISDQEQVKQLMTTRKPVLSGIFRSVEGIHALDIEYPVFSKDEKLAGSVSVLVRSSHFLAPIIESIQEGFNGDVWVIQRDSRILYRSDEKQIGSELFMEPVYKFCRELLSAGNPKESGYWDLTESGHEGTFKRKVFWETVDLYGTEWRIIVADDANGQSKERFMPGSDRDAHGCIGSAGYSWCEEKQKCLRIWEESCP
jgi:hypothetical protein